MHILHRSWTVLLRIHDDASVAGWCLLQMMMRMFHGRVVRTVVARMHLILSLVMLKVTSSGSCSVIAVVVVEAAVGVHDHTPDFVQVRRGVGYLVTMMGMIAWWQRVEA